jgi:hypothetical protein
MTIHFTSGYHPEGDSQTKCLNQTLEQYLHIFCNYQQDNWSEILPLAEFTYNNSPSATTGITPFFTDKGYHPNIMVIPECELASVKAREFIIDLEELHAELRIQMAAAQKCYQGPADRQREPAPDFHIGQQVYVCTENISTTRLSKKLSHLHAIHPVFHVSQLKPSVPNTIPNRTQPPPPPVDINDDIEYEIAKILDSKNDNQRKCKLLYFVIMKVQMKKTHGYWLMNSTMHKKSLRTSTLITLTNLVHFHYESSYSLFSINTRKKKIFVTIGFLISPPLQPH